MNRRAIWIGVNDYPGTSMDLAGCVPDAVESSARLTARGYTVTTLLDSQATRARQIELVGNMYADARLHDKLIVGNSSHGTQVHDTNGNSDEPDGWDEATCPYDVMEAGPITDDTWQQMLGRRAYGVSSVVFMDCCFSGTVTRFAPLVLPAQAPRVRFMPPSVFMPSLANGDTSIRAGRPVGLSSYASLLVAACQEYEYCYDAWFNGKPNGAFTRLMWDAWDQLKPGSTYNTWMGAIRRVLPSQQYPQTPWLLGTPHRRGWEALI